MHWLNLPSIVLLNALLTAAQETSTFSKASNDSLLWGPYRPNLYFGVKPRLPNSLSTGLLWGRVEDYNSVARNVRFTCEQDLGMDGYGWDKYDARTGGVQTIRDKGNGIDVETSFVKFDEGKGGWAARVRGTVREDAEPSAGSPNGVKEELKTSVFFTAGVGGPGGLDVLNAESGEEVGFAGDVVIGGRTNDLGEFKLTITEPEANSHPVHNHPSFQSKRCDHTLVHSVQVPEEALWQGKAITFGSIKTSIDGYVEEYTEEKMPPPWQAYTIQNRPGEGNMHVVQKVFEGPFSFDIFYTPSTAAKIPTSEDLTLEIAKVVESFDDRYSRSSFTPQKPFHKDPKYLQLGKTLLSNLIGGIGYFHGDQLIDRSYAPEYDEDNEGFWQDTAEARARNEQKLEGPYELFTSVPSRPFFPRGFLWDEGFHLLPIVDWDADLVMQILSSWFNTMDSDGWIAREMILGPEARSKVPAEFQVQYPHYANPPTLFMVIEALLDHPKLDQTQLSAWLKGLYPLLQRNFAWYRRTQAGEIEQYDRTAFSSKEAYRWRGRTPQHILTSGLDDYPRAQPPHPGELHTDLISWIGLMARSMQRVAAHLGEKDEAKRYAKIYEAVRKNVDDLHWSEANSAYCDATVDEFEESVHVCHKGYVSLFPFMTGLLGPSHKHLGAVLDLIQDDDELWSQYGIRSLSKRDVHYGTDENYWRSPVWMNLNFLILQNLLDVAQHPSASPHVARAGKLYTALRKNLVNTVFKSWEETGFAWEQYNPDTGAGQRTQHFTGWTSLVASVMGMPETPIKGVSAKKWEGHDEL